MAKHTTGLLDPETVNRAEALGLHARYVVEGYMAGEHKSPFRGFAVEFTQHREYVPGDDIRHLDWKVLGRTDRYYLKQYEQETNYVAHVVLDGSESMKYGSIGRANGATVTKLQYGKMLAACLSYLILHQRDAVAVGVFDTAMKSFVPRTGNLASIHNIMNTLASFDPREQTNIANVLHTLAGQIRRKGITILISDLFDDEERILDGIQHLRFGGSEVIVFHVMDPFELEFPFSGMVEFEGLEMPEKILTRPREIRKSYLREVEAFRARIREGCERQNTHYQLVDTSHPLHEMLSGYLAFRLRTHTR
jgi:uncharacterized protein (DUF58 family)